MARFSLTHHSINAVAAGGAAAAGALGRSAPLPALLASKNVSAAAPAQLAGGGHDARSQHPNKRPRRAAASKDDATAVLDQLLAQLDSQRHAAQNEGAAAATGARPAPAGQPAVKAQPTSGSSSKKTAGSSQRVTLAKWNTRSGAASKV